MGSLLLSFSHPFPLLTFAIVFLEIALLARLFYRLYIIKYFTYSLFILYIFLS